MAWLVPFSFKYPPGQNQCLPSSLWESLHRVCSPESVALALVVSAQFRDQNHPLSNNWPLYRLPVFRRQRKFASLLEGARITPHPHPSDVRFSDFQAMTLVLSEIDIVKLKPYETYHSMSEAKES